MAKNVDRELTSAFDLFGKSYDVVMRNIKNFAILLFLPFLGSMATTIRSRDTKVSHNRWASINIFSGTMPAYSIVGIIGVGLILFLLIAVAALIIQAMLTGLELEGSVGKTPSLNHLWQLGKKYWLRLFGLALVIGMYLLVAAALGIAFIVIFHNAIGIFLGVILIIVAVLFVLRHYYLAPYVLLDKDAQIFNAMEESAKISKDHSGAIFSIIGVSILLSLSGIVPFIGPVISFILGSFYSVAPALRYQELKS